MIARHVHRSTPRAAVTAAATVKRALVERPTDDRTGQPTVPGRQGRERVEIRQATHAPRRDHRQRGGGDDVGQAVQVRALERAVPADLGHDQGCDPGVLERPGQVQQVGPRPFDPTSHGHVPAPGVEADGHGVTGGEPANEFRVLERGGPDDDPRHAGVEQGLGRGFVAHATTGLHRDRDRGGDGGHHVAVHGLAGPSRVEVDDMDPRRAIGLERAGPDRPDRRRSRSRGRSRPGTAGRSGRRADRSPDRDPSADRPRSAGGGEPRRSWRAARMPAAPDFSGWNWVAITFPRCAIGRDLAAVVAGGDHVVGQLGSERVHEVHPRLVTEAVEQRRVATGPHGVPLHLRVLHTLGKAADHAVEDAEPRHSRALLRSAVQQLHADADAEERTARPAERRARPRPGRCRAARSCTDRSCRHPGAPPRRRGR